MKETLDAKLARKVMRDSQVSFSFLAGLKDVIKLEARDVRASSAIASVDIMNQFEVAETGIFTRFLPRDGQSQSSYLRHLPKRLGFTELSATTWRQCERLELKEIKVVRYEADRFAIGPTIPDNHWLYDERDWVRGLIARRANTLPKWHDSTLILNLVEFTGHISLAERVAEAIALEEDVPKVTDLHDLTIRTVQSI